MKSWYWLAKEGIIDRYLNFFLSLRNRMGSFYGQLVEFKPNLVNIELDLAEMVRWLSLIGSRIWQRYLESMISMCPSAFTSSDSYLVLAKRTLTTAGNWPTTRSEGELKHKCCFVCVFIRAAYTCGRLTHFMSIVGILKVALGPICFTLWVHHSQVNFAGSNFTEQP